MRSRTAQITLFVILGILLLLSIGLVLYSTQQTTRVQVPEIFREETPVLFVPIRSFVDECISSTAEDGIRTLGAHGGYLTFDASEDPTESEGVRMYHDVQDSAVPYWFYFASPNTCTRNCNCASEKPPLKGPNSIESRISEYVDENLPSCINNFEEFRSQGFDFRPKGQVSIGTDIGEHDVSVFVTYPFEAQKGDQKQDFSQFVIRLPVNINRTYSLAESILNTQQNYSILEKWTTSVIGALSVGVDRNRLPPLSASQFGPGSREERWSKRQVKDKFRVELLPVYTPLLQVYPLHNFEDRRGTPLQQAVFLINNPYPGFDAQFADYDAYFNYLNWPIYFDITGRGVEGDSIGPEAVSSGFFTWLGILRRYNFYYDTSFPVVVQLHDPEAFNSRGYDFYFGLEANVRDNKEINCTGSGAVSSYTPLATGLCRTPQACAGLNIEVTDARTLDPVDDVTVSFGTQAEHCPISQAQDGSSRLPSLANGMLSFSKEGYVTRNMMATVLCDVDRLDTRCRDTSIICSGETLQVELEPYRRVEVIVEKARYMRTGRWQFDWNKVPLGSYDYAVIQLQPLQDNPSDPHIEPVFALYNLSTGPVEIPLAPGNYQVDIDLMYQLPNAERTNILFNGKEYEEEVTTEDIPYLSDMQIGGAYRTFRFTTDFLDDHVRLNTPITFGVIASPQTFDGLNTDDHIATMGKKEQFSSDHPGEVSIE